MFVHGELVNSETAQPGVSYLHVTGRRTGLAEWMPLQHWHSRPRGDGPRRWTPCASPCRVSFSPVDIALDVFRELHPDAAVDVVWYAGHDTPGATYYHEGEPPVIALSLELTISEAVEVLLHELAHAVTGHESADHGPEFEAVLAALTEAYERQTETLCKLPGFRLIQKGQEKYATSTNAASP